MSSHRDLHLLRDASDTRIFSVIDEVLRSGSHAIDPPTVAPEANGSEEWWFEIDGAVTGPLDLDRARTLWEDGVLTPDTACWREGFSTWLHLSQVEELAEQLAPRREARPAVDAAASFLRRVERRRRLPEPAPPPGPQPEWEPDIVVEEPETSPALATTFVTAAPPGSTPAPALPVARPLPRRRDLRHAIVSGLVAGTIIAAALAGLRAFWPLPAPPEPIVVYVRDDAPQKDARAKRKAVAKKKQQKKKPSSAARPQKQKRSKVDVQFDRVFASPRR